MEQYLYIPHGDQTHRIKSNNIKSVEIKVEDDSGNWWRYKVKKLDIQRDGSFSGEVEWLGPSWVSYE